MSKPVTRNCEFVSKNPLFANKKQMPHKRTLENDSLIETGELHGNPPQLMKNYTSQQKFTTIYQHIINEGWERLEESYVDDFLLDSDVLWKGSPQKCKYADTILGAFDYMIKQEDWINIAATINTKESNGNVHYTDLKKWAGQQLNMGVAQLKTQEQHWAKSGPNVLVNSWNWARLGQRKWCWINSHFHWNKNELTVKFEQNWRLHWKPGAILSMDESGLPCEDDKNCPVVVYNPDKPLRNYIELFSAVDATNTLPYLIFCKPHIIPGNRPNPVITMLEFDAKLSKKEPFHWVTDRRFGGLPLVNGLNPNRRLTCSIMANRPSWIYSSFFHYNFKTVYETRGCKRNNLAVLTYLDKKKESEKMVNILTYNWQQNPRAFQHEDEKMVPRSIAFYRKYMGGVDQFNKILLWKLNPHRKRKWTDKLFSGYLKIATINAHCLYTSVSGKYLPYPEFLDKLIEQLITSS
jgi:hypothetical protein